MSGGVTLEGRLVCADAAEAAAVARELPAHVRLTRAEPGCLHFEVVPDPEDPLVFLVSERFASPAAFAAHQARTRDSRWWHATRHIARDYRIAGA